jgi:endoglucanase
MRPFILAIIILALGAQDSFAQMTRITSRDTPAHRAALRYMRGINLGNYLEYGPGHPAGNQTYNTRDLDQIRAEGFDHVRIPVAWHLNCGPAPDYRIDSALFQKADFLVNSALARGLAVIIDQHHFDEFIANPVATRPKLYALWRQVAEHYASFPDALAFEFLNEPNGAATTAVMNTTYAELIRQTRETNPNRTLFVGPGEWNGIGELRTGTTSGIVLPNNDQNIIVTVHCYDPYYFTHQGAEWALPDTATTGLVYPGPPPSPVQPHPSIQNQWVLDWFRDYNRLAANVNPGGPAAFLARLRSVRNWADYWGRPCHVGEFGCYEKADPASRLAWHKAIREVMDQQRLGWAMWDWKAGFHYQKDGVPNPPGMREAIFPPPTLSLGNDQLIRMNGAVGKTYVVERAERLNLPLVWQPVSTQTLTTNYTLIQSVPTNLTTSAIYRVQWRK